MKNKRKGELYKQSVKNLSLAIIPTVSHIFFSLIRLICCFQVKLMSMSTPKSLTKTLQLLFLCLHQRIAEHKNSAIGRHFSEVHGNNNLLRESQFTVLRKCQSKFDCLVFEMLFIKKLKPNLNIQTDSIRAKLFV